ncbi:MAG: hypothetical protein AAGA55_00995 [Planctomycetota bacterium]
MNYKECARVRRIFGIGINADWIPEIIGFRDMEVPIGLPKPDLVELWRLRGDLF